MVLACNRGIMKHRPTIRLGCIACLLIPISLVAQEETFVPATDVSFTIHENDLDAATKLLTPIVKEVKAAGLITKNEVAKLSVVGIGMRSHSGVAAQLFKCLGAGGINIQLISTSEIKIAVVIDGKDVDRAAQLTHQEFGLASLMPAAVATRTLG